MLVLLTWMPFCTAIALLLHSAETEKQWKHMEACLAYHACFTPLCFSVDGMLGMK